MICELAFCLALLSEPVARMPACMRQTFVATGKHARKFTYRTCLIKFPDGTYLKTEGM